MSSNYPSALDTFTDPAATDSQSTVSHSAQHAHVNDAVAAIQLTLGVSPAGRYASVLERLNALGARTFDAVTYGAKVDGSTDDTGAWQSAINACAAAGGGEVTSSKFGVSVIAGALQDTSGANAQLTLPSLNYSSAKQIGVTLRGATPAPSIFSVIGATPVPDGHLVLKSTLASGNGQVIGCTGPDGGFSGLHLDLKNLTVSTVANPTISGVDLHRVASVAVDGVVIDTGSYDIDGLAQPTTATSYGLRLPANNNGARVELGRVDVAGFYTGYQCAEHTNGRSVAAWGCRVGVEFAAASNHASIFTRFMAVHCTTPVKFTGVHAVDIWQLDIEHANSSQGWRQTTYDVDDASNFGSGFFRWHSVLAGSGDQNSFTVNGATGITTSRVGAALGAGGGGSTPTTVRDRLTAAAGNTILTLGATPISGSPLIWVNNTIKWPGTDYTIAGSTITFGTALSAGDVVLSEYQTLASSPGAAGLSNPSVNVVDNFNRADSTSSLGSTSTGSKPWTALSGTWGINGNRAYLSSGTAAGTGYAVVDSGAANCTVQATAIASGGTFYMGLVLRATDLSNFYTLEIALGASYAPKIYKTSGGATSVIATGAAITAASGDVITVVLSGSTITAKRNGSTIVSVTDATFTTQTKHGFYLAAGAGVSPQAFFDDFSVQP